MGVIVVGVDSSDGAKAALRFALAEAKLRQAKVLAVHVWQFGFYGAGLARQTQPLALTSVTFVAAPRRHSLPQWTKSSRTGATLRWCAGLLKAPLELCSSKSRGMQSYWSSARVGSAVSPDCCSVRSVSNAHSTQSAPL